MAVSSFKSEQYASEEFVESVGAVLFSLSSRKICVLHFLERDEYVLAKGRRNCGENRRDTAIREIMEESGFPCRLLPVNMASRCPPAIETEQLEDEARYYTKICEPFTLQLRHLGPGNIKVIWWYIAAINDDEPVREDLQENETFAVELHSYGDVLERLTYQSHRDMVKKAIEIVIGTYGG